MPSQFHQNLVGRRWFLSSYFHSLTNESKISMNFSEKFLRLCWCTSSQDWHVRAYGSALIRRQNRNYVPMTADKTGCSSCHIVYPGTTYQNPWSVIQTETSMALTPVPDVSCQHHASQQLSSSRGRPTEQFQIALITNSANKVWSTSRSSQILGSHPNVNNQSSSHSRTK